MPVKTTPATQHFPAHAQFYGMIALVILLDRITKLILTRTLQPGESVDIIPPLLSFTHVSNTGAVFGILEGQNVLLAILTVLIIGALLYVHRQNKEMPKHFLCKKPWIFTHKTQNGTGTIAFSLIISGAVSNLIDRIFYGYVIDFIDIHVWPVFNIADSAITVGIALLLIASFRENKEDSSYGRKQR